MPQSRPPITFVVSGQAEPAAGTRGGAADPRLRLSVRVGGTRAGGEPVRLVATPGEDLVVLHLAGGPSLRLHPETARDLLLGQGRVQRGGAGDPERVEVGAELAWQGGAAAARSRGGLGKVVLAGIDLVSGRFKDRAADFVAKEAVAFVDGQVEAGVYSLPASGALAALKGSGRRLAQVPAAADGGPILVLVHGTFVDTASTFGRFWTDHADRVAALQTFYAGRVYALDHPTLGASPFANALTLVQALPRGARLHLLTHSRGGLVAEVLARLAGQRALGAADLAFFDGEAYAGQRDEMQALLAAIVERDVHVERVVRVACPARGTLLASRRLDAYLSVLGWTLKLAGVPVLGGLVDFIDAVAERRADPRAIPGLQAMIPDQPLVRWLNQADAAIPGELRVVAGDLQGDSLGSWLKTLLADAFYWGDNDIVVHTRSMYGGTPRSGGGASFVLDQSGGATHFDYFRNRGSVDAIVDGLVQSHPAGYRTIGPLSWVGESSDGVRGAAAATRGGAAAAAPSARPAVLLLPGILGSNLKAGEQRIWLGLRLLGGFDRLRYDAGRDDDIEPDGPISLVYNALIEHLQRSHDVIAFDFDWRLPIEQEARRLADEVEVQLAARAASNQPVRLLVHSMGGVVARTMQLERPQTFQRLMAHPGARLVMLGTPNGGSWAPMQVLSGDDTFGNALVAFGAPFQDKRARQLMAAMPGFIQLQAGLTDPALALDREENWRRLAADDLEQLRQRSWWHRNWEQSEGPDAQLQVFEWGVPPQAVLDQAKALRLRLDAQKDQALAAFADKLLLVVGRSKFTPDGFAVRADEGFVYLDAVDGGDGRVPLRGALLPGVKTWRLDAEHGSLPSAKSAFVAFEELLVQGDTERLPRLEAPRSGDAAAPAHVASRPSRAGRAAEPAGREDSVFVAEMPLAAAAPAAPSTAALQVGVVNGNVAFVDKPLFVGHYRSLALTGTEKVVDGLIGRTMSSALQLQAGFYPEAPGAYQVFANTRRDPADRARLGRPPAVVVVGLGEEGKLHEAALAASMRQAVLGWLQRVAERRGLGAEAEPTVIAATLIGSGGIGISTGAAARALAQGVADANRCVAGNGWPAVVRLELVELYLDRASDAWRELRALALAEPEHYRIDETITSGTGPLRRPLDSGYRGAEYDFIRVATPQPGRIEFAFDSRRARNELREQSTQVALVDELVQHAASDANSDRQLGRTLFQLLVPGRIEHYLGGASRVLLEMDVASAAIPWELLDTPRQGSALDERPWALRCRLLRKMRLQDEAAPRADAIADDDVLVVGEPLVDRPGYGALPGALAEAKAVAEQLQRHAGLDAGRVRLLVREKARPIINALLEKRWRVVHIAGHGEAGPDAGVVLSGQAFLGPNEIEAMRTVPELVFVNCCHLAAMAPGGTPRDFRAASFAAGVAERLIHIGVRCVVAAGWAVDDEPAQRFALTFYEHLLAGDNFGNAVGAAREAAYERGGNTWAAYQCYGDPEWRWRSDTADAQAPVSSLQDDYAGIASAPGLALALEALTVGSQWEHRPAAGQLQRIGFLEGRFAARWGDIGAVAEGFGVAYAAAGAFEPAIDWLRRAQRCDDASASIKVGEQLGNLLVRRGHEKLQERGAAATKDDVRAALAEIDAGRAQLRALVELQPTAERWSLVGSAWKRLSLVHRQAGDDAAEARALVEMDKAYGQAGELARDRGAAPWMRPTINRLAGQLRRQQLRGTPVDPALLQAVAAGAAALPQALSDFWVEIITIEADLYPAVADGTLAAGLAGFAARYDDLQQRASSPSAWRTVHDQLVFVLGALREPPAIAELLRTVEGYAR